MARPHETALPVFFALAAACVVTSSPDADDRGDDDDDDGTGASADDDAGETAASVDDGDDDDDDDDGPDDTADDSDGDSDTGDPPPTQTEICDGDGTCDREADETCAACPEECGSCEIEDLPDQTARYVDEACAEMGDGTVDECAGSPGGAGRFNELQTALASLVAGETLYVHPGDYWREVEPSDSGAVYSVGGDQHGTAEQPIVVTAADRDALPVIHSCDPSDPEHCPAPALAAYGNHVVLDHLAIRGRVQIWGGSDTTMQHLDCSYGWGACGDGNWSCLRIESSTNGHAHHNWVHDVSGAGNGESCEPGVDPPEIDDRGSGLKEFSSDGAVWEFNTVESPPQWGYDLHRNSVRTTVRFNEFLGFAQGVNIDRTVTPRVYGNLILGGPDGAGGCLDIGLLNEAAPGALHLAEVHHNVCMGAQTGFEIQNEMPASVHDNVVQGLVTTDESPRNVSLDVIDSADHNAYDAAGNYRRITYEDGTWSATLADWQAAAAVDGQSIAADGGACTFVSIPDDLRIVEGACATLGTDGGPVGPYAITTCVGHECG